MVNLIRQNRVSGMGSILRGLLLSNLVEETSASFKTSCWTGIITTATMKRSALHWHGCSASHKQEMSSGTVGRTAAFSFFLPTPAGAYCKCMHAPLTGWSGFKSTFAVLFYFVFFWDGSAASVSLPKVCPHSSAEVIPLEVLTLRQGQSCTQT